MDNVESFIMSILEQINIYFFVLFDLDVYKMNEYVYMYVFDSKIKYYNKNVLFFILFINSIFKDCIFFIFYILNFRLFFIYIMIFNYIFEIIIDNYIDNG